MKKIVALFLILLLPIALSFIFGCSQKKEEPVATEEAPGDVQAPAQEPGMPATEEAAPEGTAKPAEEAAKPAETPAAPTEKK